MTDFTTLANIARPQMMGNAPSPIAGWMYGGDMARHDNLIAQATKQAQQQAMMEAMKAEEASLARPGRLADIERGNAAAQDNLDAYKQFGRDTTMGTAEGKKMSAQEAILGPQTESITALATATTPEEVDSALQLMKAKGHGRIGPINLTEMPANVAKQLAERIYKSKIETPQLAGKKAIEDTKGQYKMLDRIYKEQGLNTRQERQLAARMEMNKLKQSNPNLFSLLKEHFGEDTEGALNFLLMREQANALLNNNARAGAARAVLPPEKAPPDVAPLKVAPKEPKKDGTKPESKSTKVVGKAYKDKKTGKTYRYLGGDENDPKSYKEVPSTVTFETKK